jgi:hypothetical protein
VNARPPKENEARTDSSGRATRSSRELQSSEGLLEQRTVHHGAFATFDFTDLTCRQAQLARELVDADPERQPA